MMETVGTLYAREESSPTNFRGRVVTLWRKYQPSDFPNATAKLFAEGPRLADGTILFPVARIEHNIEAGQETFRYGTDLWNLEWLPAL
jgi:hypothetical protein